MKRLLEIATEELEKTKKERSPTWETFERMAVFATCKNYMQGQFYVATSSVGEMLQEMSNAVGASETLEVVILTLDDFCEDVNCVSPHLVECLKEKLKQKANKQKQ